MNSFIKYQNALDNVVNYTGHFKKLKFDFAIQKKNKRLNIYILEHT